MRSVIYFVALFLFFLMLFVPTSYRLPKSALMGLLCMAIILKLFTTGRKSLHKHVIAIGLLNIGTGIFFTMYGWNNNNPGVLNTITVYVVWPILYMLYVSGISSYKMINGLTRALIYSSYAIGIYSLMYILHSIGYLPDFLYIELDQGQLFSFTPGNLGYRLYSLGTVGFLCPFFISALIFWKSWSNPPVNRTTLYVGLIFCLILILISGRRGLLGLVIIAPILTLMSLSIITMNRMLLLKSFCLILCLFFGGFFLLDYFNIVHPERFYKLFLSGFRTSSDAGAIWRLGSGISLFDDWLQKPILGYGNGAVSSLPGGAISSPWAYELSYLALLFHTGLVGTSIYFLSILWIFRKGFQLLRSHSELRFYLLPLLVGLLSFLILNSTNPYLEKYDFLWVIFFPVSVINYWLIHNKQ